MSLKYICGGTSKLSGAGLFLNTRPARSKVDPWHGHKKPPNQSEGKEGCAPVSNFADGEQPKCEQIPTTTKCHIVSSEQNKNKKIEISTPTQK